MKKRDSYLLINVLPIGIIISIVPLIVRLKIIPLKGSAYDYWIGGNNNMDFFSYYKSRIFIILTFMALLILCINVYYKKINLKRTKLYITMLLYISCVTLSAVFSEHIDIAIWGFPDRYEGMLVLICYMIILFVTINLINDEIQFKFLFRLLIVSAIIICIIGLTQITGHNFFNTFLGKRLIASASFLHKNKLAFPLEKNAAYSTLYNYNYVGSYLAMIFPLTISIAIVTNSRKQKLLLSIAAMLMFVVWVGGRSRAGIVGGIAAIIVIIILQRKAIVRSKKYILFLVLSLIIIFFSINMYMNNSIFNRIHSMRDELSSIFKANDSVSGLKSILTDKNTLNLDTSQGKLNIEFNGYNYIFKENKNIIARAEGIRNFKLNANKFSNLSFSAVRSDNFDYFTVNINNVNQTLNFIIDGGTFKYITFKGNKVDLLPVESIGFKNNMSFASERGYIWSRALPLLKHTLFLGYGADCFAIYFPQNDIAGKINAYWATNIIVDKPHNMYLQNIINNGLLSFIALVAIFIIYVYKSIKILKYKNNGLFWKYNLCIFPSIIGYLVAAFFNDSVVSVAPVFWILMGLGISACLMDENS